MLQYRLSALFLIFFFVATTMALFGVEGIWMAGALLLAAFCINRARKTSNVLASLLILLVCRAIVDYLILHSLFSSNDSALAESSPGFWPIALGVVVWLISIIMLFHRAVRSRRKPENAVIPPAPSTS